VVKIHRIAFLVFGSGFCAIVYQTVWMREFRLVFGASTGATAAVLAIFMGGLGLGSAFFGKRVDLSTEPLAFYGRLELGVTVVTALTPLLIGLINAIYFFLGGSSSMGAIGATPVRLVLAALVLGLPTFLMGGSLPAVARAVESDSDIARRNLAILYGANTLGAVLGAFFSTFVMIEHLGNRATLWTACVVNLLIAFGAIILSSLSDPIDSEPKADDRAVTATASPRALFAAAAVVGFAFFLIELVWYRLLTPLLGGTTYTFGLILALALLGIGLGGCAFGLFTRNVRPTLGAFALTCVLEGLFFMLPYALGDSLAVLALLLRPLNASGFLGSIFGWTIVAGIVVLPGAFLSGIQFPLLVAIIGQGQDGVGRDVGLMYAWNTVGAILGSLAGGFFMFPMIGALATWRLSALLLTATGFVCWLATLRGKRFRFYVPVLCLATVAMSFSVGPTAVWRHGGIGAGRASVNGGATTRNSIRDFENYQRRILKWETDGRESAVALTADQGLSFVVNGKIDGNARFDAPTQIISGLLGAFLHAAPRHALVVGLGTGSTAGWLGAVPSMVRVDVAELEPSVVHVAEVCSSVNHDALHNPKVNVVFGDGREILLTTRQKYDLIASEPSNPYRAGVAGFYTADFYRDVASKLNKDGLFLQWMQAYEIDARTIRTIYKTFQSVFPYVQTWDTQPNDLLLIGSFHPISMDAARLRTRVTEEPFKSAFLHVWRVNDLEGVLAHYVAGSVAAGHLADQGSLNTDDHTIVEFAFARTLGVTSRVSTHEMKTVGRLYQDDFPSVQGFVDRDRVENRRFSTITALDAAPFRMSTISPEQYSRSDTHLAYVKGDYARVISAWTSQHLSPEDPSEILNYADSAASMANESALGYADRLEAIEPLDADLVRAHYYLRKGEYRTAAASLAKAFEGARWDPWMSRTAAMHGFQMVGELVQKEPAVAPGLYESLSQQWAAGFLDQKRLETLAILGSSMGTPGHCNPFLSAAIQHFEPAVPWKEDFLRTRLVCAEETNVPAPARARNDLRDYLRNEPEPLSEGLRLEMAKPVKP